MDPRKAINECLCELHGEEAGVRPWWKLHAGGRRHADDDQRDAALAVAMQEFRVEGSPLVV